MIRPRIAACALASGILMARLPRALAPRLRPRRHRRLRTVAVSTMGCADAVRMGQDGATGRPRIAACAKGFGMLLEQFPGAPQSVEVAASTMACAIAAATEVGGATIPLPIAACAPGPGMPMA